MSNPLFLTKSVDDIRADVAGEHHLLKMVPRRARSRDARDRPRSSAPAFSVLTGHAAAANAGPAVALSFIIAGVASTFAGLCYAEMASMIPIAGSAYTYAYATMGELVAWIIGWDLILEYMVGRGPRSASAGPATSWRSCMTSSVSICRRTGRLRLSGGAKRRTNSLRPGAVVNLPAMLITAFVTVILVIGIKESARFSTLASCS